MQYIKFKIILKYDHVRKTFAKLNVIKYLTLYVFYQTYILFRIEIIEKTKKYILIEYSYKQLK